MFDDLKSDLEKFSVIAAVIAIPFLVIGRWVGFSWPDLGFIGLLWALIAYVGIILMIFLEDRFGMIWPLLPGLAWLSLWRPIHRLAVEKAGFSGVFLDELGRLPWWSSLSFRLTILVGLIVAGYGISYRRSNR